MDMLITISAFPILLGEQSTVAESHLKAHGLGLFANCERMMNRCQHLTSGERLVLARALHIGWQFITTVFVSAQINTVFVLCIKLCL